MDRLEAMSTFLAVVEAGSLSAAARKLKTPLATVSRKISELESHLRTRLFTRSSRKVMLTDAGSSYLAACKRILADVTERTFPNRGRPGVLVYRCFGPSAVLPATHPLCRPRDGLRAVDRSARFRAPRPRTRIRGPA
jgi:regulatory helix-turn-helix LysR family protein